MLRIQATADVNAITPLIELHGDEPKKAVAVKLVFKDVPLDAVEAGFVSQLSLFYSKEDALRLSDIEPEFKVTRSIENVDVDFGGAVKFINMRVRRVSIKLREAKRAEVRLSVVGQIEAGIDRLHGFLRSHVAVTMVEQIGEPTAESRAAA